MTHEDPALEQARKQVKNIRDFFYHLMVYVLVNAMLVAIDLQADGANTFFGLDFAFWVIIGWGFGLAGHAISVFFGEGRVQKVYARIKEGDTGDR